MASRRRSILVDARVNGLPGANGIARTVVQHVAHMGEADDGFTLRVLVNSRRPQIFPLPAMPAGAEIVDTDITLGAVHRSTELASLIRKLSAAALYVPYPTFAPLVRPCPIVVTVHDCTVQSSAAFAGGRLKQAWLGLAFRTVLGCAAAVTAPSAASLDQVRMHYPRARRPTLVPNGVDASQFTEVTEADAAAARVRFCLPDRFVLSVGAHRPHKNHEVLVRALAALPPDVSLVIVGQHDPGFPVRLPGLVAGLGLESRVRLLPAVPDDQLAAVYRAASAFAFPSLAEGYGLPVLEAMAAGLPVVMSDIPVLAEVAGLRAPSALPVPPGALTVPRAALPVPPGALPVPRAALPVPRAALTVPPADVAGWASALGRVLGDPRVAGSLVDAGAAVAAAATWERGAGVLRRLLGSVAVGESGEPSGRGP